MDKEPLNNAIFLSASIPDPRRNVKYFDTSDVIAIRDAVCALAQVVLPKAQLVWGGHPAITPIIRIIAESLSVKISESVTLYQSKFFTGEMPEDNAAFENIIYTNNIEDDRDKSLYEMRKIMLSSHVFHTGVFIGGMEGVEDEFKMFKELHPTAKCLPIASTGAAAKIVFDNEKILYPNELDTSYAYVSLFTKLLAI
jgi:hypothetical protein